MTEERRKLMENLRNMHRCKVFNPFNESGFYYNNIHDVVWTIREGFADTYFHDGEEYIVERLIDREQGEILRSLTLNELREKKMCFSITYQGEYLDTNGNLLHILNPNKNKILFGSKYEAMSFIIRMKEQAEEYYVELLKSQNKADYIKLDKIYKELSFKLPWKMIGKIYKAMYVTFTDEKILFDRFEITQELS